MNTTTQLKNLYTTIRLGKIAYTNPDRKINDVQIEIALKIKENETHWETLEELHDVYEFSASGCVWNGKHSDYEMCGQCLNELAIYFPNDKKFQRIVQIWEKYHLNDLKAGTKKQTEAIEILKKTGWKYEYNSAVDYLKNIGLYEDNGYKYGHGWLFEPIPEDIIEEIKALMV